MYGCTQAEALAALGGQSLPRPDGAFRGVLLLKGLPFQADPDRVAAFFKDYRLGSRNKSVFIIAMTIGRPSGNAFVIFESEEEANRAKEALVCNWRGWVCVLVCARVRACVRVCM